MVTFLRAAKKKKRKTRELEIRGRRGWVVRGETIEGKRSCSYQNWNRSISISLEADCRRTSVPPPAPEHLFFHLHNTNERRGWGGWRQKKRILCKVRSTAKCACSSTSTHTRFLQFQQPRFYNIFYHRHPRRYEIYDSGNITLEEWSLPSAII